MAPLVDHGQDFWVVPGTSSWNSLVGRIDNAIPNLLDAAEVGRARGAGGYLITDWGDNGHLQPPSVSFGPLVFGGAVSWSLDANRELDLNAVLDRYVFDDASGALSGALDSLGRHVAADRAPHVQRQPAAGGVAAAPGPHGLGQARPGQGGDASSTTSTTRWPPSTAPARGARMATSYAMS